MKSLLKQYKRELALGLLAGALIASGLKLSQFHTSKVEAALIQGCDSMAMLAINPLLQPSCLLINGKLAINIGLLGKTFDLESGNEIVSE